MSELVGSELVIEAGKPAHGGYCLAHIDQGTVFVRFALPGEKVRIRITNRSKRVLFADAIEILTPSPDRVPSLWPAAGPGGVGGGELAHVSLKAQRTWKRWVLQDCLTRLGGTQVAEQLSQVGLPQVQALGSDGDEHAKGLGRRSRVELTVSPAGQLGMHGYRSKKVIALDSMPLAAPAIRDLELFSRKAWRHLFKPGARVRAVAPSDGQAVVSVGEQVYGSNAKPSSRRRVQEIVDASGLGLGQLHYQVHVNGFWQVHPLAPTTLVREVIGQGLAGMDNPKTLELYSGAGLFTLPLSMLGAQVTSLEGSLQAVRDGRRNLHDQGARLVQANVDAAAVSQYGDGAQLVVLDPPRAGAGREVVEAIGQLQAQRVVLVACDPAALARDLGLFVAQGYQLEHMAAFDLFPHTHHFETVCVLSKVA